MYQATWLPILPRKDLACEAGVALESNVKDGNSLSGPVRGNLSTNVEPGCAPGGSPPLANMKRPIVTTNGFGKSDRLSPDAVCRQLQWRLFLLDGGQKRA